uniref:Uncharacterized protein n=1 Tax=Photinus pyralis TaxID=7054 RepID=A0A1Y1K0N1_PHOPY
MVSDRLPLPKEGQMFLWHLVILSQHIGNNDVILVEISAIYRSIAEAEQDQVTIRHVTSPKAIRVPMGQVLTVVISEAGVFKVGEAGGIFNPRFNQFNTTQTAVFLW